MNKMPKANFLKVNTDQGVYAKREYHFDVRGILCHKTIANTENTLTPCLCVHNEATCHSNCHLMAIEIAHCNDPTCRDNPRFSADNTQEDFKSQNDCTVHHRHEYRVTLCNGRKLNQVVQYQPEQEE